MNKFPVVILDNGSDLIKIGNRQTEKPSICHNALLKTNKNIYIADEIDSIQNTFNIFNINRPFSNSILTDFDLQNEIWNKVFNKMPQTKLNQKSLLMTESLLNPKLVRSNICETIFEKFDFNALMLSNGLKFAPSTITNPLFNKNCCVVVDCGYSNTRIVPIVNGIPINFAAKTTIGSKLLNERLGQVLSFRQFDVKKDYFLTEKIRINSCYISNNFETELNEIKFQNIK
ncbi:Actin-related protein 6 [Bonamia ostreae]|uniref:Actin-related protein 6 n=1 Tax=Bonamia ostreae TaxID=126728 RepID=A0ABV2ANV6_9EUKA